MAPVTRRRGGDWEDGGLEPGADIDDLLTAGGSRPYQPIDTVSRAPRKTWTDRYDLFYDQRLFDGIPRFDTYGRRDQQRDHITGKVSQLVTVSDPEFLNTHPRRMKHSDHIPRVIAALMQFHQMTTSQLCCFLGYHPQLMYRILKPMYENGLLARANFAASRAAVGKTDKIHQLNVDDPLLRWIGRLDRDKTHAVTTLLRPVTPSIHIRHNLMVAELALRVYEIAQPVPVIFGERQTAARLHLRGVEEKDGLTADGYIVRPDGLRIILELGQAQQPGDVERKMLRWARHLARLNPDTAHTVVVFINAASFKHETAARNLRNSHKAVLTQDALNGPGAPAGVHYTADDVKRARSTVFIANWADWFPARHTADADFATLAVGYLQNSKNPRHGRVHLLGPQGDADTYPTYKRPRQQDFFEPIEASDVVACVPRWNKPNAA